jgi:hypothetical protein
VVPTDEDIEMEDQWHDLDRILACPVIESELEHFAEVLKHLPKQGQE